MNNLIIFVNLICSLKEKFYAEHNVFCEAISSTYLVEAKDALYVAGHLYG